MRGTTRSCKTRKGAKRIFLSTSPLRGTTTDTVYHSRHLDHFYPRPPCGGRQVTTLIQLDLDNFYPRPPCGGRRKALLIYDGSSVFLSTSPLRGTTCRSFVPSFLLSISIHVPLAGDDPLPGGVRCDPLHFYPRPPCGGRRRSKKANGSGGAFLSTSPLRGTTPAARLRRPCGSNFYPRPPCGGRPQLVHRYSSNVSISIHVPLAGDDRRMKTAMPGYYNFYPRPPCGGRHIVRQGHKNKTKFLSTSPLRGTTSTNTA